MMTRSNIALALVLAGLIVLDLLLAPESLQARDAQPLFPELSVERAVSVELALVDGSAAEYPRLVLRRSDPGDPTSAWILPQHFDYPVMEAATRVLFDRIGALTDLDLLSHERANWDDFGVGAEGLVIRIEDGQGEALAVLVQGRNASQRGSRGGRASYVRCEGRDEVFRAPSLARLPTDPVQWMRLPWILFETATVRAIEVERDGAGSLRLERRDVSHWARAAGASVRTDDVRQLLSVLASRFFERVLSAEADSFAAQDLALRLEFDGRAAIELRFGARAADGVHAVQVGQPWVVNFSPNDFKLLDELLAALE
jgi:hypothetical protein